jgi:hypothetical protein
MGTFAATGMPFFVAGLNFHLRTASTAISSKPQPWTLDNLDVGCFAFRSHHNNKNYDALILLVSCFRRIIRVRTIFALWHAYAIAASLWNVRFRFVATGLLSHCGPTGKQKKRCITDEKALP